MINQSTDELVLQAESILAGLNSHQRQLSRLFELEDELIARGATDDALIHRIDDLRQQCQLSSYRCRYRVFT